MYLIGFYCAISLREQLKKEWVQTETAESQLF